MSQKISHTLCIFANDTRKMYHIWSSKQANPKETVTVHNAFWKAGYALNGKDGAEPGATTTFLRVLSSTNKNEWTVTYEKLGEVNKQTLKEQYAEFSKLYESEGYTCITREPKSRFQSGRYAGRKWVARKLSNMTYAQVKDHTIKMLEDCLVDKEVNIPYESTKVSLYALKEGCDIENISQLWSYVFNHYSEKGGNYMLS